MTNLEITQHITDLYQQLNCIKNGDCCAGLSGDTTIYDRDGTFGTNRRGDLTDTFTIFSSTFSDNEIFKVNQNGNINFGSSAAVLLTVGLFGGISDGRLRIYNTSAQDSFTVDNSTTSKAIIESSGKTSFRASLTDTSNILTDSVFDIVTDLKNGAFSNGLRVISAPSSIDANTFLSKPYLADFIIKEENNPANIPGTISGMRIITDFRNYDITNLDSFYNLKGLSIINNQFLPDTTERVDKKVGLALFTGGGKLIDRGIHVRMNSEVGTNFGYTSNDITDVAGLFENRVRRVLNDNDQKDTYHGIYTVVYSGEDTAGNGNSIHYGIEANSLVQSIGDTAIGGHFNAQKDGNGHALSDLTKIMALQVSAINVANNDSNHGNVVFGAEESTINKSMLEVTGNIELVGNSSTLIMERPDGQRVEIKIDNSNNVTVTNI